MSEDANNVSGSKDEVKKERRRIKQCEYARTYRAKHPEKVKSYRDATKQEQREREKKWRGNNGAKLRERARRYYLENREKVNARSKLWTAANREKRRALARLRYANNREQERERGRIYKLANKERLSTPAAKKKRSETYGKYRLANLEKLRAMNKKWQSENREWIRQYKAANKENAAARHRAYLKTPEGKAYNANRSHVRRARERNCTSTATKEQIALILRSAKRCVYCRKKFTKKLKPTLDHIVPLFNGGSHSLDNLTVACKACNSSKSAKDPFDYARSIGLLLI